jgi:HEAT repeat protein
MRRLTPIGLALLLVAGCGPRSTDDWLRQLKDAEVVKRRQAVRELGARLAEAGRIVPALTDALRDESGYVRHDAATTLGKFGGEARTAVPALVGALKDRERTVRTAAAAALKKVDPTAAAKAGIR